MENFKSIKGLVDALVGGVTYHTASGGNLRLSKCPFCGSKKAYINPLPSVNGFCCFKCGKNLGFMGFFREMTGNNTAKYREIVDFLDGKKDLSDIGVFSVFESKNEKSKKLPQVAVTEVPCVDIVKRHEVYNRMLALLTLSEKDKYTLLKRGLSEQQVEKLGYKTCPSIHEIPYLIRTLENEGYNLQGIPGFYQRNGKTTMTVSHGIFIPFRSHSGKIQGLQIRLSGEENVEVQKTMDFSDTADYTIVVKNTNSFGLGIKISEILLPATILHKEKTTEGYVIKKDNTLLWEQYLKPNEKKIFHYAVQGSLPFYYMPQISLQTRYIWFTSGNQNLGCSATSYTHFVGKLRPVMYVTEGALKADVAYSLEEGRSFIAVAGVTCTKRLPDIFFYCQKHGVKEIRLVFDMDRIYNEKVEKSIQKVQHMAENAGLCCTVVEWDIEKGKGIDDYLLFERQAKSRSQ